MQLFLLHGMVFNTRWGNSRINSMCYQGSAATNSMQEQLVVMHDLSCSSSTCTLRFICSAGFEITATAAAPTASAIKGKRLLLWRGALLSFSEHAVYVTFIVRVMHY